MRRHIVVANQTLGARSSPPSWPSAATPARAASTWSCPSPTPKPPTGGSRAGLEGVLPGAYRIARTLAGGRLQHELDRLREAGVEADGEVVDPMPVDAIRKIASREEADEVIVSTLPRRLSRWMAMDLPTASGASPPRHLIVGPAGPLPAANPAAEPHA